MFRQRMLWPPTTGAKLDSSSSAERVDLVQTIHPRQMEPEGENGEQAKSFAPFAKPQLPEGTGIFNMDDNGGGIYFDPVLFPDCSRLTQSALAEKVTDACGGRMFIKVKEYASKARKRIRFSCGSCATEEDKCQFTFQINFISNSSPLTVEGAAGGASTECGTGRWFLKRNKGSFVHTCGIEVSEERAKQFLVPVASGPLLHYGSSFCSTGFPGKRDPEDEEGSTKPPAAPTSSTSSSPVPPEEETPKLSAAPMASKPTHIAFVSNPDKRAAISPLPPPASSDLASIAAAKLLEMNENAQEETSEPQTRSKRKKSEESSPESASSRASRKKRKSTDSQQENKHGKKMAAVGARSRAAATYPSMWQPTHVLLVDPPRRPSPAPEAEEAEPSQRTSAPTTPPPPPIALKKLPISPQQAAEAPSVRPVAEAAARAMDDDDDEDSPEQVLLSMRENKSQKVPKTKPDELMLLSFAASCLAERDEEDESKPRESPTNEPERPVARAHKQEDHHMSTADEESHDFHGEDEEEDHEDGENGGDNKERVSTSVFWMRRFNELKDFRSGHGHCLVPQTYKPNPALGNWVKNQRAQYKIWQYLQNESLQDLDRPYRKTCSLNAERIRLLEEIGFQWRVSAMNKSKGKKAPVEMNSIKIYNQHEEVKKSRKSKHDNEEHHESKKSSRKHKGPKGEKEADDWMNMFSELEEFRRSHGICPVSRRMLDQSGANPRLWPWMTEQRRQWQQHEAGKPSRLTKERMYMLDGLGFSWDGPSQSPTDHEEDEDASDWMDKYCELQKYILERGTFPPPNYLGAWIPRQQSQYRLAKANQESFMTPERILLLDQLRFPWQEPVYQGGSNSSVSDVPVDSDDWDDMYHDLKDYRMRHGDCLVPFRGRNIKLIDWMAQQRRRYQEGSEARTTARGLGRVRLLNDIGFEWDDKEAAWMTNFVELGRYFRKHGAGMFPPRETHSLLWLWVNEQAMWYFNNTRDEANELTTRRRELLDLIGFPWYIFIHDQSATH